MKKLPKFNHGGMFGPQTPPINKMFNPNHGYAGTEPEIKIKRVLQPTSKENANLEAEKGETVITNLQKEGLPEFYTIGGKPHSRGGTPLNLPDNSFFFSKDKSLSISDPDILAMFGKTKGKYTPAELSKTYDLNKYREILANPSSDKMQRKTAEMMLANYARKLSALSLIQESKKGFDRGIPQVAIPYMEYIGMDPGQILTPEIEPIQEFKKGGQYKKGGGKNRYDIPDDARIWDSRKSDYDPSKLQVGDYVFKDGQLHLVTQSKRAPFTGTLVDDPNLGTWQEPYSMLVDKFQNQDVRDAFYAQYRKELEKAPIKGRFNKNVKEKALAMDPDDVIANFLNKIKINLAINSKYGDLFVHTKDTDDWDLDINIARNVTKSLGYDNLSDAELASFQAGYVGLNNLADNPLFKDIRTFQAGKADEPGGGTGKNTISDIDVWDGDTTSGQVALPRDQDLKMDLVNPIDEDVEDYDPVDWPVQGQKPADFWTQDLVNLQGAIGDLYGVKKYDPWQAIPEFEEATPTFVDFRGTAARIGSQGRGLAGVGTNIAGPQGYGALFSHLQRGMVNPILQAQEMEARTNAGIANQFELANTGARNQYNTQKAMLDTNLYDKTVIANQQFDNSKRALRQNVRNMFNQAWTNRGNTQALNSMQNQFDVDPITGFVYRNNTIDEPTATNANTQSIDEIASDIMNSNPGIDWPQAIELAKLRTGVPEVPEGLNSAMFAYPGYTRQ